MEIVFVLIMAIFLVRADEMAKILHYFKQFRTSWLKTKSDMTDAVVTPIKDAFREGFRDNNP